MEEKTSHHSTMLPLLHHHYHHLLLVLHLLVVLGGGVRCFEEKRVMSLQGKQWGEKSLSSPCSPQRSRREKGSTILEMKHHSYCTNPIASREDKLQKILISDDSRVSSLESRIRNAGSVVRRESSSEAQIPLNSGLKLQTMNYIVTVELGEANLTVIVDTGSDLTWFQCQPCASCYDQQDPLFDPSASPSYQSIQCSSPTCHALQLATGVPGNCGSDQPSCNYLVSYGDGSYSRGVLARDRIELAGTTIGGIVFGCGRDNRGLFGGASGLMGLGRSPLSLVAQTSAQFGGVFSYCLPTKDYDSSGSLTFGDDPSAYKNTTPITYITMISDPQNAPFYYLNLTGMSVGGADLRAPGFESGKILIDSGTVISRLVPSAYNALRAEFLKQFAQFPSAPGFEILDTCFNLSGYGAVDVPALKLRFDGGAEVEVDASGVLYFVKADNSQVCLALASLSYEDEVGILGNYQQKNRRVVYDTMGFRVGFAEETCNY